MKKQIACSKCNGKGYITLTRKYDDYCGIGSEMCSDCGGTGLQQADMTNADRIRAMSDAELAAVIMCPKEIDTNVDECIHSTCSECCKEWLQQPVEDS